MKCKTNNLILILTRTLYLTVTSNPNPDWPCNTILYTHFT